MGKMDKMDRNGMLNGQGTMDNGQGTGNNRFDRSVVRAKSVQSPCTAIGMDIPANITRKVNESKKP